MNNVDANERIAELEAECAALEAHVAELRGRVRIADYAADVAIRNAKKAKQRCDGYRESLKTLVYMLDGLCGQIELARDIAFSYFGAEGLSLEDVVRQFFEESAQ